ncbi:hypothetical protein [Actinoplanes derwentensis]|nr:hypothetical protein [Actinoplanes derwentensis]
MATILSGVQDRRLVDVTGGETVSATWLFGEMNSHVYEVRTVHH